MEASIFIAALRAWFMKSWWPVRRSTATTPALSRTHSLARKPNKVEAETTLRLFLLAIGGNTRKEKPLAGLTGTRTVIMCMLVHSPDAIGARYDVYDSARRWTIPSYLLFTFVIINRWSVPFIMTSKIRIITENNVFSSTSFMLEITFIFRRRWTNNRQRKNFCDNAFDFHH